MPSCRPSPRPPACRPLWRMIRRCADRGAASSKAIDGRARFGRRQPRPDRNGAIAMVRRLTTLGRLIVLLPALAVATAASAQTASTAAQDEIPRFLVYFDEFSANLSEE